MFSLKDPTGFQPGKNTGTTTLFSDNLGEAAEDEKGKVVVDKQWYKKISL